MRPRRRSDAEVLAAAIGVSALPTGPTIDSVSLTPTCIGSPGNPVRFGPRFKISTRDY
jgi:hypothetical protein